MPSPTRFTHVVIESDPEYDDTSPIQIAPGQVVTVIDEPAPGDPDTDFPAFVHVTTTKGDGWVPSRYLDGARPSATVVRAYDTTVLMPRVGDQVVVLDDDVESGWSWCRSHDGNEGWVMNRALRPLSARATGPADQ